jgi:hypothetical protein
MGLQFVGHNSRDGDVGHETGWTFAWTESTRTMMERLKVALAADHFPPWPLVLGPLSSTHPALLRTHLFCKLLCTLGGVSPSDRIRAPQASRIRYGPSPLFGFVLWVFNRGGLTCSQRHTVLSPLCQHFA